MSFFESLRNLRRNWQSEAEHAHERLQLDALRDSNPTDVFVTMKIMGNGELERMTHAGWQLVSQDSPHKHLLSDEYLIRMARPELLKQLGLTAEGGGSSAP